MHKRRKSDRSSSSVRCDDPKRGSRRESDSDPKPVQDETAGRNLKKSWSRAPPEQGRAAEFHGRDGDALPGLLFRPNGKPPKRSWNSREPPRKPEERHAYEVVSNLKRLCTEFVEGLNQEDAGGINVNIARTIMVRFQGLLGIQGCAEFGMGTSSPKKFRDILEEAAEAHGVKKSVKIIKLELYVVLNVVVWGAAGAENNPAAVMASNSG